MLIVQDFLGKSLVLCEYKDFRLIAEFVHYDTDRIWIYKINHSDSDDIGQYHSLKNAITRFNDLTGDSYGV